MRSFNQEYRDRTSISQDYGIKLKKLRRKNNLEKGQEPTVGQSLILRNGIGGKLF